MISVVIPAHNEEKAIGTALDELIEVLEGQAYEIIMFGSVARGEAGDLDIVGRTNVIQEIGGLSQ